MNNSLFRKVLKLTTPIFFGYMAIGIPFGLMIVNAGYPWWIAPLMCLTLYTGSGQYFAVGLFASGAGLFEIILVQFLLSIRHFFYGLSLIGKYKGTGKIKAYLIHAITDETFALVSSVEVPENVSKEKFYTMISVLDQSYWTLGSTIGAVACNILQKYKLSSYLEGIDFALTALFVVLLIEQIKKTKDFLPPLIGGLASAVTVILFKLGIFDSSNIIWTSICFGLGTMLLVKGPSYFKKNSSQTQEEATHPVEIQTNQKKENENE